jgi:thiamine-phosphate diphosphorylase/hydroxyethylthiazole kinase
MLFYLTTQSGGINLSNVARTLYGAYGPTTGRTLDGVAVISAIVSSEEPHRSAEALLLEMGKIRALNRPLKKTNEVTLLTKAADCLDFIKKYVPVVHQVSDTIICCIC